MKKTDLSVPLTNLEVTGVIDQGCEFEGKLCFQGTVRINGAFKGKIYSPDTLIIGEGGRIDGEVDAGVVIVSGEVQGNIKARHRLEIHRPAVLKGDIWTPSLMLDDGAVFEGKSKMGPVDAPPIASE